MNCETCDGDIRDNDVKVWKGRRVCPACYQVLNKQTESESPDGGLPSVGAETGEYAADTGGDEPERVYGFDEFLRPRELNSPRNRMLAAQLFRIPFEKENLGAIGTAGVVVGQMKVVVALCRTLGIALDVEQAINISRNCLVPHFFPKVSLTTEERAIAVRLTFLSLKAIAEEGRTQPLTPQALESLEKDSQRMVANKEHGLTVAQKVGGASGCFGAVLAIAFYVCASVIALFLVVTRE